MSDNPLLKDLYFTDSFLQSLADDLAQREPDFDRRAFLACCRGSGFEAMVLMNKMRHITGCLHAHVPGDYAAVLELFLEIAPAYTGFDGLVFSDYVAQYGRDDWERSLPALRELTRVVSAEFAIRPFLRQDAQRAVPTLYEWAGDPDPAVRRLASEGSRPRLPWGMALTVFKRDPSPILPILARLRADPSEDVRRSVANNLNDIAKDHPELVLDLAYEWLGESEEVNRLVKHACRTLLKAGDTRAMRLFGFADPAQVQVAGLAVDPPQPSIGDSVFFGYDLLVETERPAQLRLEYALTFARGGERSSRKVFFQREATFEPGRHSVKKKHSFRNLSTRKHYPGAHVLEIIVNGVIMATLEFELA